MDTRKPPTAPATEPEPNPDYRRGGLVYPLLRKWVEVEFLSDGSVQGELTTLGPYELALQLADRRTIVYFKRGLLSIREAAPRTRRLGDRESRCKTRFSLGRR